MTVLPDRHDIETLFIPAWQEWRAECSCGWTGSYLQTEQAAEREGERHAEAIA